MGKTKDSKKAGAATTPAKAVKNGGVTKASQTTKAKSKDLAKAAAKNIEKVQKKSKKVTEPESSDDSDSSDSSSADDSDDSSDDSESEEETKQTKKPVANGKAKAKAAESSSESDDSSDDDSDDAEEDVKAKSGGAKVAAESSDDSSEDDSDSDSSESEDEKPAKAVNGTAKAEKDSSDDSSDSSEDDSDSDSDSDSDESDSEDKTAEAPSKKRKAEDTIDATPKKTKTDDNAPTTLFAGSLSWGVDDDSLRAAFADFEGLTGARVVYDRNTQRSKGFGYVDFEDAESCAKAYEAMQGQEIDGRAVNLDYANAKPADATPQARAQDRAAKHGDSVSPESDTLFVGNLPFDIDQDGVRAFFGEVCEVVSVRLPTDPDSGRPKGFGYVTFGSVDEAKTVFQECNGAPIGNGRMSRSVRLDFASQRPQQGGGGGFGGRGGGRGGFGGRGGRGGGDRGGRGGRGGFGGRGGGRGGFGSSSRGGSSFSGTKVTFD